ncbi:TPA: hypothetical protein RQK39_000389 [Vibrio vulnificus]|nr:hypothetical protein [Vibrio vulnificus]
MAFDLGNGNTENKLKALAEIVANALENVGGGGPVVLPFKVGASGELEVAEAILISQGMESLIVGAGSSNEMKKISLAKLSKNYEGSAPYVNEPVLNLFVNLDVWVTGDPSVARAGALYWASAQLGELQKLPRLDDVGGGARLKCSGFTSLGLMTWGNPADPHPMLSEPTKIIASAASGFTCTRISGTIFYYGEAMENDLPESYKSLPQGE